MNEILNIKINDSITVKQATHLQFMQFVMKKINDSNINNNITRELNMVANSGPFGQSYPDDEKIKIINKLISAGIKI